MEVPLSFPLCFDDENEMDCNPEDSSIHFDHYFPYAPLQTQTLNGKLSDHSSINDSNRLNMLNLDEDPRSANVISDAELASLNIKDLNRKLKEKGLSKETMEKLKQKRRTLKNRKYATDCREKKDSEVQTLEVAKDYESGSISDLEQRNEALRLKLSTLKSHYSRVVEFAKKNNIQLRERNVPVSGICNDVSESF